MNRCVIFAGVAGAVLASAACRPSMPPPTDRLASSRAAARTAEELGATRDPQAALHLQLATDQIRFARELMKDNDNKRADLVLQRANADAELSVMLAKESAIRAEAEAAKAKVNTTKTGQ